MDGLIDTVALLSAILRAVLRKFPMLVPPRFFSECPPPDSQIMVAYGDLEHLLQQFAGIPKSVTLH